MSKITNEQLKILLDNKLAAIRCIPTGEAFILQACTNGKNWHPLISRRGHIRLFKSYDAMVNHLGRMTDKSFKIVFNGDNDAE